jgi:NAD(P)-dependent dehydrogenase (short-subunit alcohol dehydrogenase family)
LASLRPTVVVTGATGAIGSATAAELARRGARVLVVARPSPRLENAVRQAAGPEEGRVTGVAVDLSSQASIRSAVREIDRSLGHVDALLNIAAVFTRVYRKTDDGLELMVATNHLGPFLLTNLLRDHLAGGGRVVTVSAPSTVKVDVAQLLGGQRFRALATFGATKAANLLFAFELARRGARWDVRSNAFHPGLVRSELMREGPGPMTALIKLISRRPDRCAADLADLALSPAFAGTTGWFFKGARRIDPPAATLDEATQRALWERSAAITGLAEGSASSRVF